MRLIIIFQVIFMLLILWTFSDLGMCQPVNDNERKGIYGVIPYMAPEVLRGYQYTKAADIYSFGIIMNELIRLLNFENLPEPVNSTDYSSSYQETVSSSSANPISECLDCELNELDLNQDDDE
ncbi:unnamed protein product [Rhizophagus irregularis]|nr:unnamed protein product [Rhizophagus irregularis]